MTATHIYYLFIFNICRLHSLTVLLKRNSISQKIKSITQRNCVVSWLTTTWWKQLIMAAIFTTT